MYLAGQLVVPIEAGAPNNAGTGDDNTTLVKQMRKADGLTYPYVSAQSYRRALRDTMAGLGSSVSPVERSGTGKKQKATTAARPALYADDDLFGYMHAAEGKGKDAGTVIRESVLWSGTLVAAAPVRPTEDFGTMTRGFDAGQDPVIHAHQFYTADLVGPFNLDLAHVGVFTAEGSGRPNYLPRAVEEMVAAGCQPAMFRTNEALALPIDERRNRVALLFEALSQVTGGAKRALHYGDRTPAIVVIVPITGGANPFGNMFSHIDGTLRVRSDAFLAAHADWADQIGGPIRIGWRTGYADDARSEFLDACSSAIGDGVVIDEPRATLRGLAADFRSGALDAWFDDAA